MCSQKLLPSVTRAGVSDQTYRVDYFDAFSLVAKLPLMSGYSILWQHLKIGLYTSLTLKMTLHCDLQEEVYKEQPPGFVAQGV